MTEKSQAKTGKPKTKRATKAAKPKTKTKRARKTKPSKPKAPAKEGVSLPWSEIVSRVIGAPAKTDAAKANVEAPKIEAPLIKLQLPTVEAPAPPPPTTIRFPAPTRRAPAPLLRFDPEEWVSVTYCGEEVFVHGEAGIFARGTTTRLRGSLATELAKNPAFKVRRAA